MAIAEAEEVKQETDSSADPVIHATLEELFAVGAHYGYSRSRRHPSTKKYVFGAKNGTEIIDLEKTIQKLEEAKAFVKELGSEGKKVLFVGGKNEAREQILRGALELQMPYVMARWIGGTLTNFSQIKKRIDILKRLRSERDSGELEKKYTKRERLEIAREIERLEERIGGLVALEKTPDALFVIDPNREATAVREAVRLKIPIVAVANTDCDITHITHTIPANDAHIKAITYFVREIVLAYLEGTKSPRVSKETELNEAQKEEPEIPNS